MNKRLTSPAGRHSGDMNPDTITTLRQHAGLTQVELAVRAGVSPSTISRHERAGTWPRGNDQRAIRAACWLEITKALAK